MAAGTVSEKNGNEYPSINPNACLIERQVGDLPKPNLLFLAELRQTTNISTRIEGMIRQMSLHRVSMTHVHQAINKAGMNIEHVEYF